MGVEVEPGAEDSLAMARALAAVRAGRPVIVVDDLGGQLKGDFHVAADLVSAAHINLLVTRGRGVLCVGLTAERMAELSIPPMPASAVADGTAASGVPLDLARSEGVGVTADQRAACIRRLVHPWARPEDFRMPGHVLPLRAAAGGVVRHAGRAEVAVDLSRLAGLSPAGVLCEILDERGGLADGPELGRLAAELDCPIIAISEVIAHRLRRERTVVRVAEARLPTARATFEVICYRSEIDGAEHIALRLGAPWGSGSVPAAVHVECPAGDIFRSAACGCRRRLTAALDDIAERGRGVLLYLRGERRLRQQVPGAMSCQVV